MHQNTRSITSTNILQCISGMRPQSIDITHVNPKPFKNYKDEEYRLQRMHEKPYIKIKKNKQVLNGQPLAKGVVLKTLVKKPRKPNSANRKCVLLKLSIGKEMVAYVPGEGHNLQEHNVVLVKIARLRDTPGVKLKCIRGAYDLPHVVKKRND